MILFFCCIARLCFRFLPLGLFLCWATDNARTKNKQYDLTLVASDSLNESVTRVTILIKDANDLPPVFNQTVYTGHLLEEMNDPLPFRLLQVVGLNVPTFLL